MELDIKYDYWWASMQWNYCHPIKKIATQAGSTRRIYEMSKEELINIEGISEKYAKFIVEKRKGWDIDKEYEKLLDSGIRFITWWDDDYPKRLKNLPGAPFALFVYGKLPDDNRKSVSIIGARDCSEYGRIIAKRLGYDLADYGVQIVSGMAYGVDGISQLAALEAKGETYAVLGCGVNTCYPRSNKILYERLKTEGGIISEYGLYTEPQARLFPPRNRIISALSDVVIVVEAREKSGTMITVDMALEQGREVAVVPGRVTDPLSTGCIKLWKQGAIPITSAEDVMYLLDDNFDNNKEKHECEKVELTTEQKIVYSNMELYARSIGELSDRSKMPLSILMTILVELQMKGIVTEVSKGYFCISKECITY